MRSGLGAALLVLAVCACGCAPTAPVPLEAAAATATPAPATTTATPAPATTTATPAPPSPTAPSPQATTAPPAPPAAAAVSPRPSWLGTRPLPLRADGFGEIQDTPPGLEDRRLSPPQPPILAPPQDGRYVATVSMVPQDVAARSTWSAKCPVALEDLRYLTVAFRGFDGAAHTGELLVHAGAAEDLVEVFRHLFEASFPIEEMRVVDAPELDAAPTGDGNNTTAFVCRPTRGSGSWSQHAYGLAVDVNPFHNPYVRGDVVLPELASAYADRGWHRPGMIQPGDVVTSAFRDIGWGWGGDWSSLSDPMHFSSTGR